MIILILTMAIILLYFGVEMTDRKDQEKEDEK